MKAIGYIWHGAMEDRKDEDVTSTLIKLLTGTCHRDAEEITIWCDNCAGTLYSSLVSA